MIGFITARAGLARANACRSGSVHTTEEMVSGEVAGDYMWRDIAHGGVKAYDTSFDEDDWTQDTP